MDKTFVEYERWRITLDHSPRELFYPTLGLNGEAGEVTDKILNLLVLGGKLNVATSKAAERVKKLIRDKEGEIDPDIRKAILLECGDVLWYLSAIADRLNSSLDEVVDLNIEKLESRKARGVLQGSGDNR